MKKVRRLVLITPNSNDTQKSIKCLDEKRLAVGHIIQANSKVAVVYNKKLKDSESTANFIQSGYVNATLCVETHEMFFNPVQIKSPEVLALIARYDGYDVLVIIGCITLCYYVPYYLGVQVSYLASPKPNSILEFNIKESTLIHHAKEPDLVLEG
jgi:hypothetical protein